MFKNVLMILLIAVSAFAGEKKSYEIGKCEDNYKFKSFKSSDLKVEVKYGVSDKRPTTLTASFFGKKKSFKYAFESYLVHDVDQFPVIYDYNNDGINDVALSFQVQPHHRANNYVMFFISDSFNKTYKVFEKGQSSTSISFNKQTGIITESETYLYKDVIGVSFDYLILSEDGFSKVGSGNHSFGISALSYKKGESFYKSSDSFIEMNTIDVKNKFLLLDKDLEYIAKNFIISGTVSPLMKNLAKENFVKMLNFSDLQKSQYLPKIIKLSKSSKCLPEQDYFMYRVKVGDNLFQVSKMFSISIEELCRVNSDILDESLIYAGDYLIIPLI